MQKKIYAIFLIFLFIFFYIILPISCIKISYSTLNKKENKVLYNILDNCMITKKYDETSNEKYNDPEYIPTITIDRTEKVVDYYRYIITEKEFEEFVRVVEAEVTGQNPKGLNYDEAFKCKLHVAQVILNRVESPYFPDTVHDVIFQKNAFTPLVDGRYYDVEISQVTIDACKAALLSSVEDTTYGCEFFSSGTKTCKYGSYVFTDEVGHSFFKSYRDK